MADIKDTQAALDTRLNTLSGSTPIVWPNIKYVPVEGTMFLRPTLLPAKSERLQVNGTVQKNSGIYQIDVFSELNRGVGPILDKMDTISDFFKSQLILSHGINFILIREINQLPIVTLDAWIKGSVQVNYVCYSN